MVRERGRLAAVLFSIVLLAGCGEKQVDLITEITELDANEIIAALDSSGIESKKVKGKKTSSVVINAENMAAAVEVLKAQGLPSQHHASLGEVFKKEGMISTPLEEKARFIYALSQELEKTLSQIDGVLIARIHIVLGEKARISEVEKKPSAAIFIKHLPSLDPDAVAAKIKRIVVSSIPGLMTEDFSRVSLSFIESNLHKSSTVWVDQWGYRMTEKSAQRFRSTVKSASYAIMCLLVLIFVTAFCAIRRSSKDHSNDGSVEQESAGNDKTDVFNGKVIRSSSADSSYVES